MLTKLTSAIHYQKLQCIKNIQLNTIAIILLLT